MHWFHKRLEVNVKNPREKRCFQIIIVFSFGSVDNSNKCTVLWKIAARLITVSTSVNNEMWVKLRAKAGGFSGDPEALLVILPRATFLVSPGLPGLCQDTCMGQAHTNERWARSSLPPDGWHHRIRRRLRCQETLQSWLMFYVGTFSPQRPTPSCQRANPNIPGLRTEINIGTALYPHG